MLSRWRRRACVRAETRMEGVAMSESMEALFSELFEAAAAGRRMGEEIARTVGQTQARWQTMWTVGAEAFTVPQIARRLGVTRQSVQRLVSELEAEGLVTLEPNPDHRTSPLVTLTPSGTRTLTRMNRAAEVSHEAMLADLSEREVATLRTLLRKLTSVVTGLERGPAA
jgi:DNA-binding MarR family transcriptional regulator